MEHPQRYIGEILVRHGALDPEKLDELLRTSEEKGADLLDLVSATRTIEEDDLVRALASEVDIPVADKIDAQQVPAHLVEEIPITFARQHRLVPVGEREGAVVVALANPLDTFALDDLRALLGRPIDALAAPGEAIDDAINRLYERKDETALEGQGGAGDDQEEELQDLIDMTDEAPVIRWVNNLFYTSVRERASDIHIEPTDKEVVVRYRIDGKLVPRKSAHRGFLPSIVARVKIEAGLNIAEKRLPQDGRITKKVAGKVVDVRVSTIPTAKGERIVMRLLDKEQVLHDLPELGFDVDQLHKMEHLISRPNGIILVTGPTGSGKTTTLYACLSKINRPERNILTVEDPVEYELKGIGQMQIQPKIGLTFASGLRSFLRQDPDVIMVGEIRDHETAEIAIHASLTGHLVLSTIHTNDAPGAVTRLVEMGVQPFLISSSVIGVLAQRLVRRLCPACREPYTPSAEDFRSLGIDPAKTEHVTSLRRAAMSTPAAQAFEEERRARGGAVPEAGAGDIVFYRNVGCDACSGNGYKGRLGIFEMMVMEEPIRREILNQSDANTIQRVACGRGMRTLREDGARQVLAGVTTVEEVLAATQASEVE